MRFCLLLIITALARADSPQLSGFDRLYVDGAALSLSPTDASEGALSTLTLANPHTVRARVAVDDVVLGELLPRATATVTELSPGLYTVQWQLDSGLTRTTTVHTQVHDAP